MHSFSLQERILEKFRPVQKLNSRNCYQIHDHPKSLARERGGASLQVLVEPILGVAGGTRPGSRFPCRGAS